MAKPRSKSDWEKYYQVTKKGTARPTCKYAIERFQREGKVKGKAVDLGCGAGNDALELLRCRWTVLALDKESAALRCVKALTPASKQKFLSLKRAEFEKSALPTVDLVNASYSLPFCRPKHFKKLWNEIVKSIEIGGRFAGDFFGIKHSWVKNNQQKMTFLTKAEIYKLFRGFEIEMIQERKAFDLTALGDEVRWHSISIVARKKRIVRD